MRHGTHPRWTSPGKACAAASRPLRWTYSVRFIGGSDHDLLSIAAKSGSMVELLIDGINERAMESLGDLLIDNGEILPEYRQAIDAIFSEKD